MPLLAAGASHRGRGRRAQPAPPGDDRGARARRAARRSSSPASSRASRGRCGSTTRWSCPALGLIDESEGPASEKVRGALGVATVVYHVVAQPGSGLSPHHAGHVGSGLASGALRGGARLRDDRATGPAGARRWSTSWRAPPSPGSPAPRRCWPAPSAPRRERRRGRRRARLRPGATPDPRRRCCKRRWLSAVASPRSRRDRRAAADRHQRRPAAQGVPDARGVDRGLGAGAAPRAGQERACTGCSPRWPPRGWSSRTPPPAATGSASSMFELGEAVPSHMDLHAAAGPVLAHLREETGESAQVGMLDGARGRLRRPARVEPRRCGCSPRPAGGCPCTARAPARCCSPSRPSRSASASSPPASLPRHTPQTITDPDELRRELATVRARGWAEAVDEREIGVASLAAPIRDTSGAVVAAISIGAPGQPGSAPCRRKRLARVVVEAGEAVSRRLGWSRRTSCRLQKES